mgnify:CR=1 FL=1
MGDDLGGVFKSISEVCEICGWEHPEGGEHIWERKPDYVVVGDFARVDKRTKAWKEKAVSEGVEEVHEEIEEIDGAEVRRRGIKAAAEKRKAWRDKAMAEYKIKFPEETK